VLQSRTRPPRGRPTARRAALLALLMLAAVPAAAEAKNFNVDGRVKGAPAAKGGAVPVPLQLTEASGRKLKLGTRNVRVSIKRRARLAVVRCKARRPARGRAARRRARVVCKAPYKAKRSSRRVTGRLVRHGKSMARGARRVRGGSRGKLALLARKRAAAGRYRLVLSYRDARRRKAVVRRTVRVRY
jgi:hypothetical protein